MFHVLAVVFTAILLGVFLHSLIRLIMLRKRRAVRLAQRRQWHGSEDVSIETSRSYSESSEVSYVDVEKAVEIIPGPEETVTTTPKGKNKLVIKQPPPVYGNFRGSQVCS